MSTTKFWLRRLIRNRTWTGGALALALACSTPSVFGVLRTPARTQSKATVRTDKAGYLAGDPVKISGEGSQPFESVSLLVSHAGGAAEAGPGHERLQLTLMVPSPRIGPSTLRTAGGVNFLVSASGASGNAAFKTSCGSETNTAKDAMN